ncbi:MAG TPA: T9SS type A sorting domain-containing protein, partial [Haliscomenobacter sp.]|nr:T9SS type A sorting domain-containing protein [Haliscomenobacter sp.]
FTRPKSLPATDLDPKILVEMPAKGELADSTRFEIPIILGANNQVIKDIYGVAFSVKFDPKLIDPKALTIEVPTSWMGQPQVNLESIFKVYPNEGRIDIAITRTDQNEVSGYGVVAKMKGIIIDLVGRAETKLKTDDAILNRLDGEILPLNTEETAFNIVDAPRAVRPEDLLSGVTVYPNPTNSQLNIASVAGSVTDVKVMALDGKTVVKTFRNSNQLNIDDLRPGMYFLRIQIGQQVFFERVIKQ